MYNVKITVENLKVLNDRCTGKFKIFKNIMIMNMIVYPYKKESDNTGYEDYIILFFVRN